VGRGEGGAITSIVVKLNAFQHPWFDGNRITGPHCSAMDPETSSG
jgi:hypothetical protein